jgi:hypothetical protein
MFGDFEHGRAWLGRVRSGEVGQGRDTFDDLVWPSEAWLSEAWPGQVRQGKAGRFNQWK